MPYFRYSLFKMMRKIIAKFLLLYLFRIFIYNYVEAASLKRRASSFVSFEVLKNLAHLVL